MMVEWGIQPGSNNTPPTIRGVIQNIPLGIVERHQIIPSYLNPALLALIPVISSVDCGQSQGSRNEKKALGIAVCRPWSSRNTAYGSISGIDFSASRPNVSNGVSSTRCKANECERVPKLLSLIVS